MSTLQSTDFSALPAAAVDCLDWGWAQYRPYFDELAARELTAASVAQWLADGSRVGNLVSEQGARLQNAFSHDTRVAANRQRLEAFQENVMPSLHLAVQRLKEKLLDSGLKPAGLEFPLRKLRAESERFRESNVPLQVEEQGLVNEYQRITGAMTAEFEGREVTLAELRAVQEAPERERREAAWKLGSARLAEDRPALSELWTKLVDLRVQMAANADCAGYAEYLWPLKHRFDYSEADARQFQLSIAEAVVPALARRHMARAQALGLDKPRPWDLACDPLGRDPLKPFADAGVLEERCAVVFAKLDPQLGRWYAELRDSQLDLANGPGKAPGGWCSDYPALQKPHIFMNAVGTRDDVNTLLHESGHAFHCFSTYALPFSLQRGAYMEFNEVASMAMELLAVPYLLEDEGGFYAPGGSARAEVAHLEHMLYIWCMVAAGDAFQHWIYAHPQESRSAAACAERYAKLWASYFPAVDYSGLDDALAYSWQRVLHFYVVPLYYIEYGLAQLGATQVWRNSLDDAGDALHAYKHALSLGGCASLPELFSAAGARLSFDADAYADAVALIEQRIGELEK